MPGAANEGVPPEPLTPEQRRALLALCAALFASAFNVSILFPFVGPMTEQLGMADNASDYGTS